LLKSVAIALASPCNFRFPSNPCKKVRNGAILDGSGGSGGNDGYSAEWREALLLPSDVLAGSVLT